jgi:hypothetical protein
MHQSVKNFGFEIEQLLQFVVLHKTAYWIVILIFGVIAALYESVTKITAFALFNTCFIPIIRSIKPWSYESIRVRLSSRVSGVEAQFHDDMQEFSDIVGNIEPFNMYEILSKSHKEHIKAVNSFEIGDDVTHGPIAILLVRFSQNSDYGAQKKFVDFQTHIEHLLPLTLYPYVIVKVQLITEEQQQQERMINISENVKLNNNNNSNINNNNNNEFKTISD